MCFYGLVSMKYFLHDTSAFDDEKISELFIKFGYEGLGLFYTFLEKIAKQEKPVKTEVLKSQLKVGKRLEKCWKFMESLEIVYSSNGESFNKQLLNFSESYKIKKEKTREKVAEWREKQKDTKSVTSYVPVSNPPKVKESKVKEKENIPTPPIEEKLHEMQIFINTEPLLKPLLQLKNQLTYKQAEDLYAKYGHDLINKTLKSMANYKPLLQKCNSIALTLDAWCEKDKIQFKK